MNFPKLKELLDARAGLDRARPKIAPLDRYRSNDLRQRLGWAESLRKKVITPRQQLLALLYRVTLSTSLSLRDLEERIETFVFTRGSVEVQEGFYGEGGSWMVICEALEMADAEVRRYDRYMEQRQSLMLQPNDAMEKLVALLIPLKRTELLARYERFMPDFQLGPGNNEVAAFGQVWTQIHDKVETEKPRMEGRRSDIADPWKTPMTWALRAAAREVGIDLRHLMGNTMPSILKKGFKVLTIDAMLADGNWAVMQQSLGVDAEDLETLIYPAGPLTQLHKLKLVLPVLRDILIKKEESDFERDRWQSWRPSELAWAARRDKRLRRYIREYVRDRVTEKLGAMKKEYELVQTMPIPGLGDEWSAEEAAMVSKWKFAAEMRLGIPD